MHVQNVKEEIILLPKINVQLQINLSLKNIANSVKSMLNIRKQSSFFIFSIVIQQKVKDVKFDINTFVLDRF